MIEIDFPYAWLTAPSFDRPEPFRNAEPDGRVRGHIVIWNRTSPSQMIGPGRTDYTRYQRHPVTTADRRTVHVGKLDLLKSHAPVNATLDEVEAFYESREPYGYVVAGEDDHGVWIAGGLTEGGRALAASGELGVSGEWRRSGNRWLLTATVLVPRTPQLGFPLLRFHTA